MNNILKKKTLELRDNLKIGKMFALYERNLKTKNRQKQYHQELQYDENIKAIEDKVEAVIRSNHTNKYKDTFIKLNEINTYIINLSSFNNQNVNNIKSYLNRIKKQVNLPFYSRYILIKNKYINKLFILLIIALAVVALLMFSYYSGLLQNWFKPDKEIIDNIIKNIKK